MCRFLDQVAFKDFPPLRRVANENTTGFTSQSIAKDLEGNFEVEIPLLPSVGNYPKNAHQDGNSEKNTFSQPKAG